MMNPYGIPQPDFGNPSLTPGNSPLYNVLDTASTPVKRGGMFGGGSNIGMAISAALNGYLAAGGNPAGIAGLQQLHQQRMLQQQQALADTQYQRDRQDKRDDFTFEQDYRAAHAQPDDFTQTLIAAGIDPNSPQGKAAYNARVTSLTDPVVMTAQGPMLRSQLLQGQGGQQAPQGVTFTPVDGGPTPQASGGFPY